MCPVILTLQPLNVKLMLFTDSRRVTITPSLHIPNHGEPLNWFPRIQCLLDRLIERSQQKDLNLSTRLFGGKNSGMQHLGVIRPQAINPSFLKQSWEMLKRGMIQISIQGSNHHFRRTTRLDGMFGDGSIGQVKMKITCVHFPKVP